MALYALAYALVHALAYALVRVVVGLALAPGISGCSPDAGDLGKRR
ncbi:MULTISPECIES: hypothetical protein [unclassified Frankia]